MLKKIVSLVVGATLVLATLGVAAADVATTSVYDAVNGKISVETAVTNANAGEVYTYLAYKLGNGGSLENLQNNEVVYVDEKVIATGETGTTFNYTTDIANDAAVVVLGNATDDTTIDGGIIEEGRTVWNYTVAVGDGAAAPAELDVTDLASTAIVNVPVAIDGVVVTDVTVNGKSVNYIAANDCVKISLADLSDGAEVVVVVASGAQEAVVTIQNAAFIAAADAAAEDDAEGLDSIMVLAKIEGAASEYGVAFGDEFENFVPKFTAKALGIGTEGYYAVRLYGFNQVEGLEEAATVWAKGYAVTNEGTVYGNACGIKIAE